MEIAGLDIYDPIKDLVKSRDVEDIAYWMLDTDYDGSNFVPRQIFFCGGDKDEFEDWRKGLTKLSEQRTRTKAERTLRVELDEDAFARLYGHRSHPVPEITDGQRFAVRVVSQFGEETTKVIALDAQKLGPVAPPQKNASTPRPVRKRSSPRSLVRRVMSPRCRRPPSLHAPLSRSAFLLGALTAALNR